ncbi:sensor histidine kinase [Deinococcus hopiensis]|uniref:histidine kinase n=1 Tax=Deinococcus hopiensis KR-140 TaxID=695939 RepID=A0A1W1VHA8_9DEIO|nr:HAMP domain-containing sensor histidine kinase [Deinococcus hopiensis]SMB92738.1 His Kinase A (phospho-acceptor) domain-containing protein [Deinococcus hopiensis KR-140]
MSRANAAVVFVVSHDRARAEALRPALPEADVYAIADAETLLREAHVHPPAAALLYTDLPGIPLAEVLPLLRQRAELAGTHWLAVGRKGLGALLAAGADALIGDTTPVDALALQVRALLRRAGEHHDLEHRVSQLQRRLDDWEHEERVRDQLVHMLVHDLKNPIAAVMGLLEVVEEDERLLPDLRDLVKVARDETGHLLHLTVNMLDVRKIQAGKMNLRPELVFTPMFEEIITQACGDIGSGLRDRMLRVQVAPNLSPTRADPEILRRVFANLISNAMKHTVVGGTIQVRVWQAENETRATVVDDGEGIPAEDIPNLFAAFEQSRLTLHGRFDTGMGLAFCKMAVEEHGGRISVESERGHGATFTFTLPLAHDNEEDDFAELLS